MKTAHWKKSFITIYSGQAFSLLGSAAVQFAIIWWLTEKTESAFILTLATIFAFLPNILFGTFAGVWIDRYNRKTVMIAADALVAASSALLGIGKNPSRGLFSCSCLSEGLGIHFTPLLCRRQFRCLFRQKC